MTDERTAVAAFLRKCNDYARASIERKQARGELEEVPRWEAYIEFNEHALEEIANGTLDRWFEPTDTHQPPLLRLDVNAMEHVGAEHVAQQRALAAPRGGRRLTR